MRYRVSKRRSKSKFRKETGKTNALNVAPVVMRGGYRL